MAALLLLFVLLLLLVCPTPSLSARRCADCGSSPVPYPLSTGPDCGDQFYKIRCSSSNTQPQLFFDTLNNSYPISSISPETQRLTIQPSPFLSNTTCITQDISTVGVQLNDSLPFNITSSNTIIYLNCTATLLQTPLNCTSESLCHTYVNGSSGNGVEACRNAPICCTFRAGGSSTSHMIRVKESGCRAYRSFVNLDPSLPVSRWPQPGMELQWISPPEPVCTVQSDCDSDSTCRPDPNSNGGVSRCFCHSGFHWDPIAALCAHDVTCQDPDGCSSNYTTLIAGLTSGVGVAVIAAVFGFFMYRRYKRIKEARDRLAREREDILNSDSVKSAKLFSGKEIKKATNNFSPDRLLGAGGFGEVYYGVLDDGTVVAVKCAKLGNTKGIEQVLNEVRILCQVNHKNLVRILGCCVELEQPLLVYEYVPNGTLSDHLCLQRQFLTWECRLSIAHATAEGLAYLHFSAVPPIYHRDVKSSNILLDDKLNAKVADFGLSRLAHTDLSHVSTCAQGTLGYLDPEYYRNYQLTDKSDVYSFGVVLLELLTSQKAIDFNREQDDVNLAIYVQRLVEEERIMDAVDPALKEGASSVTKSLMDNLLGLLRIKVKKGINLAVRDVRTSDPYCVIKMGKKQKLKTRVIKKDINPEWNEDLTLSVSDPSLPVKLTVFDHDTFSMDDKMGDAEFDIKPFVEALKMNLTGLPSGTVITRVLPCRTNCLAEESRIVWNNDKVVQDMILRLRNVECGEVELQLQWIELPGTKIG